MKVYYTISFNMLLHTLEEEIGEKGAENFIKKRFNMTLMELSRFLDLFYELKIPDNVNETTLNLSKGQQIHLTQPFLDLLFNEAIYPQYEERYGNMEESEFDSMMNEVEHVLSHFAYVVSRSGNEHALKIADIVPQFCEEGDTNEVCIFYNIKVALDLSIFDSNYINGFC